MDSEEAAFVYVLVNTGAGRTAGAGPVVTYVGWTLDIERRLAEHNGRGRAGAKSTRGRDWGLIYAERLPSRIEAMRREWHLKRDRALRRRLALWAAGGVTSR